jgi:tetratricopeptide (TPR) repeat protein
MLNYILPPIIIIISVSILIMFLFRKAEKIPAQDFALNENRDGDKKRVKIMSAIGEFALKMMERVMHRSKLWSLKFHNVSNVWFQTIREKRQRDARIKSEALEQKMNRENKSKQVSQNQDKQKKQTIDLPKRQELRPMVSAGVTMPQALIKEKNKLEEALIRRIAINPKDIEAYERLGDYYLESENFQDSLECFRQVLKLSPSHHKARLRIRRLERIK